MNVLIEATSRGQLNKEQFALLLLTIGELKECMRQTVEAGKAGKLRWNTGRSKMMTINIILCFPECRKLALKWAATKPGFSECENTDRLVYCGQLGGRIAKGRDFCTGLASTDFEGKLVRCTYHVDQVLPALPVVKAPRLSGLSQGPQEAKDDDDLERMSEENYNKLTRSIATIFGGAPPTKAPEVETKVLGKHSRSSIDEVENKEHHDSKRSKSTSVGPSSTSSSSSSSSSSAPSCREADRRGVGFGHSMGSLVLVS